MNTTQITTDLTGILNWSEPKEITTRVGKRMVRESVNPSQTFWALWKTNKEDLKQIGISVLNKNGQWQVTWWSRPDLQFSDLTIVPNQPSPKPVITSDEPKWSKEQLSIFEWFRVGKGNLIVRARAGTGKTTTIKTAFGYAPEEKIIYVVFNKKNQLEAEAKITDSRVDVKTLHSLGNTFIKMVWTDVEPDPTVEVDRVLSLHKDLADEVLEAILRLVQFSKNMLIDPTIEGITEIAVERMIDAVNYEAEEAGGWTVSKLAATTLQVMELSKIKDSQKRISFNDMVWLPVVMNWVRPVYDLVCVDEAQDMNLLQLTMAQMACKPGGRICIVGDDRQAVYGFRGAVSDGLDMMKEKLNASELGLTVTYRCPKKVVDLAKLIVPDYQVAETAPDGIVDYINDNGIVSSVQVGDAVLSRINAPLMALCLQTLRAGKAARIEGRDIGKQLANLARKMKAKSVPDFLNKIEKWGAKMIKRVSALKNADDKIEQIQDQVSTLVAVAEGVANVREIETRLLELFQDSDKTPKSAVVFSSVHKAKGLEWGRVFILKKTFFRKGKFSSPQSDKEESNIYYVAITRAQKHLIIASPAAPVGVTAGTLTGK